MLAYIFMGIVRLKSMELRDYQVQAIDDLTQAGVDGHRKFLLVCPTGAGKTIIASKIILHASGNGYPVLFLAHRRELIFQCADKLKSFGVDCGIILSQEPQEPHKKVQVASVQSYHVKVMRKRTLDKPPAELIIFDEAHHLMSSNTWMRILEEYPNALVLGMTATPINRRGSGMGHCFDAMIKCPSISELVGSGHLVSVRYFAPSIPDLNGVKIQAGDYSEPQLESRMDTPTLIGEVCENWSRICPDRKTIVFASGVKHSIHLAECFRNIGIKAEHLDGTTDKEIRDNIIARFKDGDLQVLVNCQVLTEGFDCPVASCLVLARPTKSLMLYLQMAGRGLRPWPGKQNLILIDHAGAVYEHGTLDQDFDWKMEYAGGTINEERVAKRKEQKKRQITCGQCKTVYEGRLKCPECGWQPQVRGKPVNTYEAYLQEIDRVENPPVDKRTFWNGLRGYAVKKNFKPGWAYFKYKEKFGVGPSNAWRQDQPIEPTLEVMSWIKYLNIKWAKRRQSENPRKYEVPQTVSTPESWDDDEFIRG